FGVFERGDADALDLADGSAVAGLEDDVFDFDLALGRDQVAEAAGACEAVFGAFASLERGAKDARVGADRQRLVVIGKSACQGDEASGAPALGEGLGTP